MSIKYFLLPTVPNFLLYVIFTLTTAYDFCNAAIHKQDYDK